MGGGQRDKKLDIAAGNIDQVLDPLWPVAAALGFKLLGFRLVVAC